MCNLDLTDYTKIFKQIRQKYLTAINFIQITDQEQERFREDNPEHNKDLNQAGNAATRREIQRRGKGEFAENPEESENRRHDTDQFLRS